MNAISSLIHSLVNCSYVDLSHNKIEGRIFGFNKVFLEMLSIRPNLTINIVGNPFVSSIHSNEFFRKDIKFTIFCT